MEFLTYLLKSVAILSLFYLVYIAMLRRDTFFTANRHYLLSGIIASLVLPFVTFTTITFVEIPATEIYSFSETTPSSLIETAPEAFVINWAQVGIVIYLIGLIIMTGRFIIQLASLKKFFSKYQSITKDGFKLIEVTDKIAPFSFFKTIVYNPKLHEPEELEMILEHEKTHAKQWHSIDLLLINMLRALQWANPITWLYKKDVEANLEFIADYETSQHVQSKKQYQLALIQASSALPVPALTNNFYHSFIKKRIIMLNKSNHTSRNTWKLSIILPLLALFLWSFNTKEIIEYTTVESTSETASEVTNLQFSANSSETELDAIEAYFIENHPDLQLKISDRKRNTAGQLIGFSFKTKFENEKRFSKRFERKPKKNSEENAFETRYKLQYAPESTLLIEEQGKNGVRLRITSDNLEILHPENTIQQPEVKKTTQNEKPMAENKSETPEFNTFETKKKEDRFSAAIKNNSGSQSKKAVATAKDVIKRKITKETSEAELATMKASLKKEYGVELTFNTKRNSKNEITSIKISYIWDDQSGNFSLNDPDGIDDFHMVLDKETNHYGFYTGEEHTHTAERLHEERTELYAKRDAAMAKRKVLLSEAKAIRRGDLAEAHVKRKDLLEEAKELREEMIEERKELLADTKDMKREVLVERRKLIKEDLKLHGDMNTQGHNEHAIMITKNTSDGQLAQMKKDFASKGIDFDYKKVKRNASGEITSIKITVDNNKGNEIVKSIKTDDGTPINEILIEI